MAILTAVGLTRTPRRGLASSLPPSASVFFIPGARALFPRRPSPLHGEVSCQGAGQAQRQVLLWLCADRQSMGLRQGGTRPSSSLRWL